MPTRPDWFSRLMLVVAGILGAGGVVAAAAASHSSDDRVLGAIALVALTQAPAALAFGLAAPTGRLLRAGAVAIGGGACLFCGTLGVSHLLGIDLLTMLAPVGGSATALGWVTVVVAGLVHRRQP